MGPWNIQWKKYISCTQGGVCTSVCLRFNDDGKRWNVFLLRHSAEDTRWYQKKVVDLTRILPLNVTEKWQFLFQNDQSAATRFIFLWLQMNLWVGEVTHCFQMRKIETFSLKKKIYYSAALEVHCMLCPSSDILIWLKIYLRHLWLNVKYRSQKNGVSVVKLFDFFHKD